ncbi:MAG TPA: hypothetical protein VFQ38_07000 [Longimicrobiales bacterium]|nr:hypothetical protein [Longimicrobiales bacterium]
MDAFSVAAQTIPGIELTPGQLAQLRAIDHGHQTRVFELLRQPAVPPSGGPSAGAAGALPTRKLTDVEIGDLRATLVADIRGMLTVEQRRVIDGG